MYQQFYGVRELPFDLTADPRFLFLTPHLSETLGNLEYGLAAAKTLIVLTGEAGTGKTTLLRTALESERCRQVTAVYLPNPALTRTEFIEILAGQLKLSDRAAASKAAFLSEVESVLRERRTAGETTALVVDEAQTLTDELLEEIRLLANIETRTEKLLPLVLAGQPELASRLNAPALRQLKQRIEIRCKTLPLSVQETASYMASRIRTAGGEPSRLFTREAVALIHECSGGIPRIVSVLCDNALRRGFAAGRRPVGCDVLREITRDFDHVGIDSDILDLDLSELDSTPRSPLAQRRNGFSQERVRASGDDLRPVGR